MPTYEYRCAEGHDFERMQKMSDPPIRECPVCGAEAERLLSAGAGLLFKGSGFYITDYRNDSYKKAAESDKGSSGAAGGAASSPEGGSSSASGATGPTGSSSSAGGSGSSGSTSSGGASGSTGGSSASSGS